GGGILNNAASLVLNRVTMTGNQAQGAGTEIAGGGAVANVMGGRLSVRGSSFSGNVASATPGAAGRALLSGAGARATIDASTFSANTEIGGMPVLNSGGGALANYGGSTMTVTSSSFDANVAKDTAADGNTVAGGAIDCEALGYLANGTSTLTV